MKNCSPHSPADGHHQYKIQYSLVKNCAVPTVLTSVKHFKSNAFISFILSQYILFMTSAAIKRTIITKKTIVYAMTHTNGSYAYRNSRANPKSADAKNATNIKSADYKIELMNCARLPVPIIFLTAWSPRVVIKAVTWSFIAAISSIVVSKSKTH